MNAIELSLGDLAWSASLLVIAGLVSVLLRLGLVKSLAFAALRATVQLALLGQILGWVFALKQPPWVLLLMGGMVVAAGWAAASRPERSFGGARLNAIASLAFTSIPLALAVSVGVVGVEPWYQPQYVVPLLGMILGNSLTGISLSMDHFLEALDARRDEIEMELALGATRWEASREALGAAVRRGMIPILNAMTVVGLVSLPGMMTGQILAGADPEQAVRYQLVVMFMLSAATALSSVLMVWLAYRRLFNADHQLLARLISK